MSVNNTSEMEDFDQEPPEFESDVFFMTDRDPCDNVKLGIGREEIPQNRE